MPRLREIRDELGSPYLRDHVDNPVDWWSWGPDALDEARRRDVPVFLSVGYMACHWCHVMAHESFEDPEIATILNDHFVAIKVDREERPDVDSLYMTATQLSSGHGGWPMSVFALPDGRPFFTGTYFPPTDRPNQVGFSRLLRALSNAWDVQRDAVEEQATEIAQALQREVALVDHLVASAQTLDVTGVRRSLRAALLESLDADGGFATAPKFPHASLIDALIGPGDVRRDAVERSLDAMARGGLYDHLGGGFARYCVDRHWHVPHFEKMLIDQAQLARVYARAGATYGRDEWLSVARATVDFVIAEMAVGDGFAASFDADAGGVEGAHVTWTPEEVTSAVAPDVLDAVLARWSITAGGDLDGRSVPRLGPGEPFETPERLRDAESALRRARARRTAPARDDKVILEWNAHFVRALLALGPDYVARATKLLEALPRTHHRAGAWRRTDSGSSLAGLSDVTALLDAHLDAFEATGSDEWLVASRRLADYVLAHFWDGDVPDSRHPDRGRGLFSSCDLTEDLPLRPKEIFDGVAPSGYSLATRGFARLGLVDGDPDRLAVATRLVELAAPLITRHPSSVADLVDAAGFALEGVEIVVPGDPNELSQHVRWRPVPRAVLITGENSSPLLAGRVTGSAYVCRQGVCQMPVTSLGDLTAQLSSLVD